MSKNQEPIMSNPRIPSRRTFLRNASLAAVAAPILTEAHFARAQQQQVYTFGVNHPLPPDTALINANENPLGPSKAAIEAIAKISSAGGRYDIYNQNEILLKTVATQMNLKPEYVALYPGSSEPLHWTVLGFTSPGHGLVTADPSYVAPMAAAMVNKAPIARVRLAADLSHDMKAMVAADPNAGVIYICNPNNPTGTITAREDILWALEHKPAGSVLLVDEAYIHLSDAQSVVDMVAAGKDLVVLRTFSKIYGMAGIRCGLALGRPDLLKKIDSFSGNSAMPITALAAATASLNDPDLIPTRKKIIGDTRRETLAWLKSNNYKVLGDPQSNCFMIDTGRRGRTVALAMQEKGVIIGRSWPIWPLAVRISVGTPAEMAKFRTAFKEVMDAPVTSSAELLMPATHLDDLRTWHG
jgi:histidinol-phosphate aminotransferase